MFRLLVPVQSGRDAIHSVCKRCDSIVSLGEMTSQFLIGRMAIGNMSTIDGTVMRNKLMDKATTICLRIEWNAVLRFFYSLFFTNAF